MKKNSVVANVPQLAFKHSEAAAILGIKETKLWELAHLDENDPRRIIRTHYGTYPYFELERHLHAEVDAQRLKRKTRRE